MKNSMKKWIDSLLNHSNPEPTPDNFEQGLDAAETGAQRGENPHTDETKRQSWDAGWKRSAQIW